MGAEKDGVRHPMYDACTDALIALNERATVHAQRAILERLCDLAAERGARKFVTDRREHEDATSQADGVRG